MWSPRMTWPVVWMLCLRCIAEGVVLRPFRNQNPSEATDTSVRTTDRTDEKHLSNHILRPSIPVPSTAFQPTLQRCCQIGKRVAKKNMVCDITTLAVVRKYERQTTSSQCSNRPAKHIGRVRLNKLSEKIAKCSVVHPRHFEKCCKDKEEFTKHMKKCQLKSKPQKRKCKQLIRKKYS